MSQRCEVCLHKIVVGTAADTRRKVVLDLEHRVYCPVQDREGASSLVRTTLAIAEHKCPGAKK